MDHVDFNSTAGPHWFGRKLAGAFLEKGHSIASSSSRIQEIDVHLAFVQAFGKLPEVPLFQRLDGIYYDTSKDYEAMNQPIKQTYEVADGVIFQSEYDRDFIYNHFGRHLNHTIIHNGADLNYINKVSPAVGLDNYDVVWCCASSWVNSDGSPRHNKRLNENIRYFQEHSGDNDVLCVAGDTGFYENPDPSKILFLGNLGVESLISLYKRSDTFIHLASQDHCPNVVVDARASGCRIVCSSSGGTKEIAGKDAIVIIDPNEHGFSAYNYNVPTVLDFSKPLENWYRDVDLSIEFVAEKYLEFMKK